MGTAIEQGRRERASAGKQSRPFSNGAGVRAGPESGGQYIPTDGVRVQGEGLANFLGWFSVGLGLAQVTAPGAVARLIGIEDSDGARTVMRSAGLREIGHGLGIFASKPRPAGAVWSRVAGDVLDLALLGKVLSNDRNDRSRTTGATLAVLGVTALDILCAKQLTAQADVVPQSETDGFIHTKKSITVRKSPEEVFQFWHNFENLPRFMRNLESVTVTGVTRSHWKAKAPLGTTVEWDAEITEERPNELISWRSIGGDVENSGTVRFKPAPGGRGTEVRVELRYDPPGGVIGSKLAMLFRREPGQEVQDDLRNFKAVIETGDIVLSDATITDGPHPARPSGKAFKK